MLNANEIIEILDNIEIMFPNAGCELNYNDLYQLVVAVVLSAQTTDKSVNNVTPKLFEKYPNWDSLSKANQEELIEIIKVLGLAKNKSKSLIKLANEMVDKYNSVVPKDFNLLVTLPGIGRKTANVVLSEGYGINRIAVDTHVDRVSKRLGIVDNSATVLETEEELMRIVPENKWHHTHHLLIHFGRYFCTAKNPKCENCFYKDKCKKS